MILYVHGGPAARDSWNFDPVVQFLADRGYAVLQVNYRGSTGYGRDFAARGDGQWGRAMQDDLDDGVSWAVAHGIADPKRVCIMGASFGGYAAVWGAIRNSEIYRCALSLADPTDLAAMLRYDRHLLTSSRYFQAWERRVRGDDDTNLAAVSPLSQATRLHIPLFLAHGELDTNVPPDQSHRMVAALQAHGILVTSMFYPKEGHGFSTSTDLADYLKRVGEFLNTNNPAG